jgi:uncharacterized DUF497 family protein
MAIEYDPAKSRRNVEDRGLSFDQAIRSEQRVPAAAG